MVLIGCSFGKMNAFERRAKQLNALERQQMYMQHRSRVQNAKSVIDSKPPVRRSKGCPPKEMTFLELMNTVRSAVQQRTSMSPRTFTKAPDTVAQRVRRMGSAWPPPVFTAAGDGRHNMPDIQEQAELAPRFRCGNRATDLGMRHLFPHKFGDCPHEREHGLQCLRYHNPRDWMCSHHKMVSMLENDGCGDQPSTNMNALPAQWPKRFAVSDMRMPHARSLNIGNLRQTRSDWTEGQSHQESLIQDAKEMEENKKYNIPQHVLKRYENLTVSRNLPLLRRLLRPKVYFDLELKGLRPLGRLLIQMYTEACPEVVLEFVRACTSSSNNRINFTRLFPPLWMEGELALTDNKTLTARSVEHDTDVLDHGSGAGILSFPSRYVRGSKRRFLSFSISFKPLKVLNGKRIAFGRVRRGHWILDSIQDYGTNSGKPKREIVVTRCGLL